MIYSEYEFNDKKARLEDNHYQSMTCLKELLEYLEAMVRDCHGKISDYEYRLGRYEKYEDTLKWLDKIEKSLNVNKVK